MSKMSEMSIEQQQANQRFFARLLEMIVEIREENDEVLSHLMHSSKRLADKMITRNLEIDRLLITKREAGV